MTFVHHVGTLRYPIECTENYLIKVSGFIICQSQTCLGKVLLCRTQENTSDMRLLRIHFGVECMGLCLCLFVLHKGETAVGEEKSADVG